MSKLISLMICLSMLFVLANANESKKKVELKDIPKVVLDAVKEKVKGFEAKTAVVEEEKGGKEYEIVGTANGKSIEVEVTVDKDGKVLKVEIEDKEKEKEEKKEEKMK